MKYLTAPELLALHSEIIDRTGGSHGVRDVHLLGSILERPKTALGGSEVYRTVFEKAAAYFEAIVRYHVFVDGNKRTALIVAARFMFMNGYEFIANNKEAELFVLKAVGERKNIEGIAAWFKTHSKKSKQ